VKALLPVALLLVAVAAGCGSSSTSGDESRLLRGKLLYLNTCSRCHQPDGDGYDQVYPNLAGNPIVRGDDAGPVIDIVLHGRGGMPSFGARPPEELAEIITYVRHAWGNEAGPVTPTQVK